MGTLRQVEIDKIARLAEHLRRRADIHTEAGESLRRVARAPANLRAPRKTKREAVCLGREPHASITRTRGARLVPTVKAEGTS